MKKLKYLKWALILSLSLMVLQSCPNVNDKSEENREPITSEKISADGHITDYKVANGIITKEKDYIVTGKLLEYQKDTTKHQDIWDNVIKIVPPEYLAKINRFVISSAKENGADAYVIQISPEDTSRWELGVAMDNAYNDSFSASGDLGYILTHELGHIITGDETQIDTSISEKSCTNYYPGSGCTKTDSYQNMFFQKYWKDIWSEFSPYNVSAQKEEAFYQKYKTRFVSRYASSNPVEDIAETFATFVISESNEESHMAKEKIDFMYSYPKLVAIRELIRSKVIFEP